MNEQETIVDIIAWLRRPREGENGYLTAWRDEIADRLEAAHKRERGDRAKLREALKLCVNEMCDRCRELAVARGNPLPCLSGCEPVRKAKAALAEPPRNCDRFRNADEALGALERHCNSSGNGCIRCPVAGSSTKEVECKIAWLFAPATEKEGGVK